MKMRSHRRFGIALLATLALAPTAALAAEVTVAEGGGADFTNIADAIAATQPGDTIRVIDQGAYGAFAYNSRTLVSDPPGASITATVIVNGADGTETTIDGFEFLGVGNAIFLDGDGSTAGTLNVLNCNFESIGSHGILLNAGENGTLIVEGCTFDDIGENAITLFRNATVTVKDTLINNSASGPGGQAGIFIDGALSNELGRVVTVDNTIIQNSFRGIQNFRRGDFSIINGSRIQDNLLNGIGIDGEATGSTLTVQDSEITGNGDRGMFIGRPITALIEDSLIANNVIDGFFQEDFVNTGVSAEITIRRSTFENNGQKGIFHLTPSNADSVVVIEDNLIRNNGERSISIEGRPLTSRVLGTVQRNRILAGPGNTSNMLTIYYTDTDSVVANNLIVGGATGIANSQGGLSILHNTVVGQSSSSVFIDDGDSQVYDIRNNIFASADDGVATDAGTGLENVAIDYNLFFDIATDDIQAAFTNVGTQNIMGLDPLFTDADGSDYTLAEGSPAIGSGDPGAGVSDDINGDSRGATPSMGAFEVDQPLTDVTVAIDGSADFTNIADAIAATVEGATITVIDQEAYGAFAFNSRTLVSDPPGASITATVVVNGPDGTETTIDGFTFQGVGNAIFLDGDGSTVGTLNVLNSTFDTIGSHGILLNGGENGTLVIEGSTFDGVGENAVTLFRNASVTLKDSLINNSGSGPGGQAGIFIDGNLSNELGRVITLDNTVIENSFRGIQCFRRAEISLLNGSRISGSLLNGIGLDGEASGSSLVIQNSEVSDNGDRGIFIGRPVSILIEDSSISNNTNDGLFQEDFVNGGMPAEITIRRSTFSSNGQKGIFHLTPSAANSTVVIEDNVLTGNGERSISIEGRRLQSTVLGSIQRNTIMPSTGNTSNVITFYDAAPGSRVANNLIVGGGTGIANSQGGFEVFHNTIVGTANSAIYIENGENQDYDIRNNILAANGEGISTDESGLGLDNVLIDHNLFFDIDGDDIASAFTNVGGNNITGLDPNFSNLGAGDYSLSASSPAIAAGSPTTGVTDDIDGNPRGAEPSIGAFEFDGVIPPMLGDINGDGVVNVADVTLLAILVEDGNPPPVEVGDINNDGVVDELDVQALAEMIVNN